MKTTEIQERNKQIALMLDWTYNNSTDRWNEDMLHDYSYVEDLKFHSDWNWLMEAVEFIEKLYDHPNKEIQVHIKPGEVCIFSMPYVIENNNYKEVYYLGNGYINKTKKEAVFIAVSDFAKLYNEGKL